ncbi:MAG: hypothetical protein DHS20C01_36560 [marine bacterium B5-7]|nr:MAG: hypothetical protein DHS20C01_36560 [marine bacterium B5-7]
MQKIKQDRGSIQVSPNPRAIRDGTLRISACVTEPDKDPWDLWFELPASCEEQVASGGDPFALALVFLAMSRDLDLVVHDRVSPLLLRNLEEFQAAFHAWYPHRYCPITIHADDEEEGPVTPPDAPVIAGFSGGLDSSFSIYRHVMRAAGRRTVSIGCGLMVHGFDIPVDDPITFENAFRKASDSLSSIGLSLIPVRTNLKAMLDLSWRGIHGALLASCLHLFSGSYSAGLIAGTYHYARTGLISHGSNPLTDPLMSSGTFRIIHDGAEYFRTQKAYAIREWSAAMDNLRVCWEGERLDRNCGRCSKCIRLITAFWANGLPAPQSFDVLPTSSDIRGLQLANVDYLDPVCEILDLADKNGLTDESWLQDLRICFERNREWFVNSTETIATQLS